MSQSFGLYLLFEKFTFLDDLKKVFSNKIFSDKFSFQIISTSKKKINLFDLMDYLDLKKILIRIESKENTSIFWFLTLVTQDSENESFLKDFLIFDLSNNDSDIFFANYMNSERKFLKKLIFYLNPIYAFASSIEINFHNLFFSYSNLIVIKNIKKILQILEEFSENFYHFEINEKFIWLESPYGFGNNYPYIQFFQKENNEITLLGKKIHDEQSSYFFSESGEMCQLIRGEQYLNINNSESYFVQGSYGISFQNQKLEIERLNSTHFIAVNLLLEYIRLNQIKLYELGE